MRKEKLYPVFEIIVDGRPGGPAGPAGDGTFIQRFRTQREALEYVSVFGATTYGRPTQVGEAHMVPRRLMERWGLL